jgi:hypothetical protein
MRSSIEIQRCKRVQMILYCSTAERSGTAREPGMTERTVEHALPEILPIRIRRLILLKGFGVFEQPAVFRRSSACGSDGLPCSSPSGKRQAPPPPAEGFRLTRCKAEYGCIIHHGDPGNKAGLVYHTEMQMRGQEWCSSYGKHPRQRVSENACTPQVLSIRLR